MAKEIKDMGASVRARLLALAKLGGQPFDVLLTRFAHERLLYRLSLSPHADRFVLKGAMLLMTWLEGSQRATRDLDLLGFGEPEPEGLLAVFREVMERDENDGVRFEPDTLRHERIREENDYGGLRFKARAMIGGAQVAIVIDIGFGDALEPGPQAITYPGLLDLPPAHLRAYTAETVIAEKFEAMVSIGIANSRLKDYYDIWMLSQTFAFEDDRLARAISATFARRGTAVPDTIPEGLSEAYSNDPARQQQWAAFCDNVAIDPRPLAPIVESIAGFLMPHAVDARALPAS